MKLNKKVLLGSSAALVALSPLAAQQLRAASVSVPAQATIAQAIAFSNTVPMNFGVLTQAGAGTAVLDFAGGITTLGAVNKAGGSPTTGAVTIKASTGQVLDIAANGLPFTLNHSTAADTMQITAVKFKYNAITGSPISAPVTAAYTAGEVLLIGGTLTVGAGLKSGVYTGAVKIDVLYQ